MKKLRDFDKEKSLHELITANSYIWSDQHFGHESVFNFQEIRKTFSKIEDVNLEKYMIERWNDIKEPVISLGDFAFKNVEYFAKQITGEKILLKGNHDRPTNFVYHDAGFKLIDSAFINMYGVDYKIEKKTQDLLACYIKDIQGVKVLFSHFPVFDNNPYDEKYSHIRKILESLYNDFSCDVNIHGHTHSNDSCFKNCINVSVEKIGFKPVQIKELLERYV